MPDGSAILEVDMGKRDRRAEHRRKWQVALRVREGWEDSDFEEESQRLQAEIDARLAAGDVTRCPTPKGGTLGQIMVSDPTLSVFQSASLGRSA